MLRMSADRRNARRFAPALEGMPSRIVPSVYTAPCDSYISEPISQPAAPSPNPSNTGVMAISTTSPISC